MMTEDVGWLTGAILGFVGGIVALICRRVYYAFEYRRWEALQAMAYHNKKKPLQVPIPKSAIPPIHDTYSHMPKTHNTPYYEHTFKYYAGGSTVDMSMPPMIKHPSFGTKTDIYPGASQTIKVPSDSYAPYFHMPQLFILDEEEARVVNVAKWSHWIHRNQVNAVIARDVLPNGNIVSTRFMSIDYEGRSLPFQTMILLPDDSTYFRFNYKTIREARRGHLKQVNRARSIVSTNPTPADFQSIFGNILDKSKVFGYSGSHEVVTSPTTSFK